MNYSSHARGFADEFRSALGCCPVASLWVPRVVRYEIRPGFVLALVSVKRHAVMSPYFPRASTPCLVSDILRRKGARARSADRLSAVHSEGPPAQEAGPPRGAHERDLAGEAAAFLVKMALVSISRLTRVLRSSCWWECDPLPRECCP